MPLEIIVLRDSGIPLFHYGAAGSKRLNELVAAFLSSVGHVVERFGKEGIREIRFEESKFVWKRKGDLFFIAFVSAQDSSQVYDVILNQLADRFVSKFYETLLEKEDESSEYEGFAETIEGLLRRFDGVPRMARRYKTYLLPLEGMHRIKTSLRKIESTPWVERGAYLVDDGYVIVSNLRTYELEATLDMISNGEIPSEKYQRPDFVEHPALDQSNRLLFHATSNGILLVLVVDSKESPSVRLNSLKRLENRIIGIDPDTGTKIEPQTEREPLEFEDHKMLVPQVSVNTEQKHDTPLLVEVPEHMKHLVLRVLQIADEGLTIAEIRKEAGMMRKEIDEVLAQIVGRGLARLSEAYPVLTMEDSR